MQVCRTNSDGFTIGCWQNKNGQDKIKRASAGLCTLPTSIDGDGCMPVTQLLAYGNANYSTLSADKTFFMMVKSIYDDINNNQRVTC